MQNAFVISHISDIDGVGSAALIKMKYGIPTGRIFFTDYTTECAKRATSGLAEVLTYRPILFITDLAVKKDTMPFFISLIKKVKAKGGKVYWFDHHPWDDDAVKNLAPLCDVAIFGENELYCGAEITRRELKFTDRFTERFCRIVHFSDFAVKPRKREEYDLVGAYALSISLYRMRSNKQYVKALRHMVDVISSKRLLDKQIASDADKFRRLNDRNVGKMLKEMYIGKNMALGFAADIQKTYACMVLIEKGRRDIGVYVNIRDRSGHMRSVKSDCSKLANRFGGGGHPHASGFSPNFSKYNDFKAKEDRKRLLTDLEDAFGQIKGMKIKESNAARKPVFG